MWDTTGSSLESTRGFHTTRFGAEEMGIGTISPKMVESQLEGDKVVERHNLVGRVRAYLKLLPSTYSSSSLFSLGFLLQWRLSWTFATPPSGG